MRKAVLAKECLLESIASSTKQWPTSIRGKDAGENGSASHHPSSLHPSSQHAPSAPHRRHDPNDYDCGKRNNLPVLNIFTDDGIVASGCGQFSGMKRFDARKAVLEELTNKGLYRETKDNPMVVPICDRSKDIVEPIIKPQWYVQCGDMADDAKKAVEDGQIRIIPESHKKTWNHWMEGMRDWCISRQLWWGHRTPAYQVSIEGKPSDPTDGDNWVSGRTEEEAMEKAVKRFKVD